MLYFAYGSNLNSCWLTRRVPSAKFCCRATLNNVKLAFNKQSKDGSAKANIVSSEGDKVLGVVYFVDDDEICELDRHEGVSSGANPSGYCRVAKKVFSEDGATISVCTYEDTKTNYHGKPYDWYLKLILSGANAHKIDQQYINDISSVASKPDLDCERCNRQRALKCISEKES